jgi:hypothetical protein
MKKAEQKIKVEQPKKTKVLHVELDARYNPHPKIVATYKDNGAMHLFNEHTPTYVCEERLFLASKASMKPIHHKIQGIYRKRVGRKEFCFFHNYCVTKDYFGNIVDYTRLVGKYQVPVISKQYGLNPGSIRSNSNVNEMMEAQEKNVHVSGMQDVYEFEWSAIKPQLQEWYRKGIIDDNTNLSAQIGDRKYTVRRWEDFINLGIDDLVLLGEAGNRFQSILQGQTITPEILSTLREKMKSEVIAEISRSK